MGLKARRRAYIEYRTKRKRFTTVIEEINQWKKNKIEKKPFAKKAKIKS